MTEDCYLYRYFDAAGVLLYVGATRRLKQREQEHRAWSPWWSLVASKTVQGPYSEDVAHEHESKAITTERPKRNGRGRQGDPEKPTGSDCCDIVGIPEIAARLDVKRSTVDIWRNRKILPEPRWTVGGGPAWNWPDVEAWAQRTRRLAGPPR